MYTILMTIITIMTLLIIVGFFCWLGEGLGKVFDWVMTMPSDEEIKRCSKS